MEERVRTQLLHTTQSGVINLQDQLEAQSDMGGKFQKNRCRQASSCNGSFGDVISYVDVVLARLRCVPGPGWSRPSVYVDQVDILGASSQGVPTCHMLHGCGLREHHSTMLWN
eukprot:4970495-Amphidinium_carterae.2